MTGREAYTRYQTNLIFVDLYKDLEIMNEWGIEIRAHVQAVLEETEAKIENVVRITVFRTG